MADVYKIVHPVKYFNDYVSQKIRIDGRNFNEFRDMKLAVNTISTADSSAIVKFGNTTVVCGIKLELAKPKAEEPNIGFVVTNVELPALCSSKFRPGPPSDYAQITSNLVHDIIKNSECVDMEGLCVAVDKLAWVLYCDMVCYNNDGGVVDACVAALVTSLNALTLPSVQYDPETEEIDVDPEIRTPLKMKGFPVATSFGVFNSDVMLVDPTAYEEDMCGGMGASLVVCWSEDLLCAMHKFGGNNNLSKTFRDEAMKTAKERARIVKKLVDSCSKRKNIK